MAFTFVAAKVALLNGTLNLKTATLSATPVEATPSPAIATYGGISGKVTTGGGTPVINPLLDIDGDNNNRLVDDPTNSRIKLQFQLIERPALTTDSSAPILGWVIAVGSSPTGSSLPIAYIEHVSSSGTVAPFNPDGVADLILDPATYPITADYLLNVFEGYHADWLAGVVNPYGQPIALALLESQPALTLSTFADLNAIAAKDTGGNPIVVTLDEFGGNITNRIASDSTHAWYRFAKLYFTALETLTNANIGHAALVQQPGPTVVSGDRLIGRTTIAPALNPNGAKSFSLPSAPILRI